MKSPLGTVVVTMAARFFADHASPHMPPHARHASLLFQDTANIPSSLIAEFAKAQPHDSVVLVCFGHTGRERVQDRGIICRLLVSDTGTGASTAVIGTFSIMTRLQVESGHVHVVPSVGGRSDLQASPAETAECVHFRQLHIDMLVSTNIHAVIFDDFSGRLLQDGCSTCTPTFQRLDMTSRRELVCFGEASHSMLLSPDYQSRWKLRAQQLAEAVMALFVTKFSSCFEKLAIQAALGVHCRVGWFLQEIALALLSVEFVLSLLPRMWLYIRRYQSVLSSPSAAIRLKREIRGSECSV